MMILLKEQNQTMPINVVGICLFVGTYVHHMLPIVKVINDDKEGKQTDVDLLLISQRIERLEKRFYIYII